MIFVLMATGSSLEAKAQSNAALGSLANAEISDLGLQATDVDLSSKKVTLKFHLVSLPLNS
ncbi:hypothetical protein NC796_19400 [Aliifodinibius sp. S!AR15-10]|nr:hypothetical protein [Aliifodinibius sp. S!AR15-10]